MNQVPKMRTVGISLQPLDVLFFRDGRPFGATARVKSGQPLPQTIAGAVWTALLQKYGCDFSKLTGQLRAHPNTPTSERWMEALTAAQAPAWVAGVQVRGPWLAREQDGKLDVLTPMPAVLHAPKKEQDSQGPLYRLVPLPQRQQLPGWQPREPSLRPLWRKQLEPPTEAATGYLTGKGLQDFLDGKVPDRVEVVPGNKLFDLDHRTGIEIAPDQLSAKEGGIYGISLLALCTGVRFYVKVILPENAPADALKGLTVLPLGGEGRRVAVEIRTGDEHSLPPRLSAPATGNHKPLLLLTTPGLFKAGWKPQVLDGHLVAAAVPDAVAVSGWDLARRGPKPTRFAAQAGSVYFLDSLPQQLPDGVLSDDAADRAQGWGCFVKGVWFDE